MPEDALPIAEEVVSQLGSKEALTPDETRVLTLARHLIAAEERIESLYRANERRLDYGAVATVKYLNARLKEIEEAVTSDEYLGPCDKLNDVYGIATEALKFKIEKPLKTNLPCQSCGERGNETEEHLVLCATCDSYPKAVNLLVCTKGEYAPRTYLAVSRKDSPTKFGLPGGKVEPGETLVEALRREAREETGLYVENPYPVFVMVCRGEVDYLSITFKGGVSGQVRTDEPITIDWVTREKLFEGPFGEYNRKLLEHLRV